jgi:hypothetical protein
VFETVLGDQLLRLCALAAAGRAEKNHVEHVGVPAGMNGDFKYMGKKRMLKRNWPKKAGPSGMRLPNLASLPLL